MPDWTQHADCISAWLLDEAAGAPAGDETGRYPLVDDGSVGRVAGVFGSAAAFSSNRLYAASLGIPLLTLTGSPFTIMCHARLTGASWPGLGEPTLVSRWGIVGSNRFSLRYNVVSRRIEFAVSRTGSDATIVTAARPAAQTWTHYAGVFDGMKLLLYVNGVLMDVLPFDGLGATGEIDFVLGWNHGKDLGFGWPGYLDEVAVFKAALAAASLVDIATNGLVSSVPDTPALPLTPVAGDAEGLGIILSAGRAVEPLADAGGLLMPDLGAGGAVEPLADAGGLLAPVLSAGRLAEPLAAAAAIVVPTLGAERLGGPVADQGAILAPELAAGQRVQPTQADDDLAEASD